MRVGLTRRRSRPASAAPPCRPSIRSATITVSCGSQAGHGPRSLRIDYEAAYPGPADPGTLRHLPVRRRRAVAQQGGLVGSGDRARAAVRRQPLSPEALLSRHARRASRAIPGSRRRCRCPRSSRRPSPIGCSRCWSGLPRTAIYALLAVAYSPGLRPDADGSIWPSAKSPPSARPRRSPGASILLAFGVERAPRWDWRQGLSRAHVRRRDLQRRRRLFHHRPDQDAEARSRA